MISSTNKYILLLLAFILIGFNACTDKWEEHQDLTEAVLSENVLQQIKANPNLSKFDEYLTSTGYADLLQSSKTFTVWAPTNQALANLDQSIINDPATLKSFVANHISNQRYFTAQPAQRVKMLNGKYLTWGDAKLEGVDVEAGAANRYTANGVLHVLTSAIPPKLSIWEFMLSSNTAAKQVAFLQSLNYDSLDVTQAEIERIDPATGQPVYKDGSGITSRNRFLDRVYDIKSEDSLYTFIMLTDAAYDAEYNEIKPYFNSTPDSTAHLTGFHLIKDLAFKGLIAPENLPDTLISAYNVKVPIDKNAIVQTYRSSNGIVYVMNKVDFKLKYKIPPIMIEGENASGFSRTDIPERIHRRYRTWASNLLDIRVRDHGTASFNIRYRVSNLYSTKYKIYWRAVNDFIATPFDQKLALKNPTATTFPYKTVPPATDPQNTGEVLIGEYTANRYGYIDLYLVAANSTNNTLNPLVLDYLKLVPVL